MAHKHTCYHSFLLTSCNLHSLPGQNLHSFSQVSGRAKQKEICMFTVHTELLMKHIRVHHFLRIFKTDVLLQKRGHVNECKLSVLYIQHLLFPSGDLFPVQWGSSL